MKSTHLFLTICLLWAGIADVFAQTNVLSIPDVSVQKEKSIALPINLDNTADVVALQFTLTIPEGLLLDEASAVLSERSDGHSAHFQKIGADTYMAMVFSSQNRALKGRMGKVLSVTLRASSSLEEGTVLPLKLSDVVIGASDGTNLVTSFLAGKVTIAKSPDLEVTNVTIDKKVIAPCEKLTVGWQVANIGGMATEAGWSEQILLESSDGTARLLGTVYHSDPLGPEGVVSRNATLDIPAVLGLDGEAGVRVKLISHRNAGEPIGLQENNEAVSKSNITVKKKLFLSPEYLNVDEIESQNLRFLLTRSGNTSDEEVFELKGSSDSRITFPGKVTVPKGQAGVYFYAQVMANGVLDNDSVMHFTVAGNDYPEVSAKLMVKDDTFPSLHMTTDAQEVKEGGSIRYTIAANRIQSQELAVKLSCDKPSRFAIPSGIVIPAGKQTVEVTVTAKEDDIPDIEQMVTFVVEATGYNSALAHTVLVDNDVPALQLELIPDAVSEGVGPLAVTAKLSRIDNIDKNVTVRLSDDSDGNIYYGRQTVEMAAGVSEVTVSLGPIDNGNVDGQRTYNLSAAVFIASCSCSATDGASGGVVTVPLTVYDDDGPALLLTASASVLQEGGEVKMTVKRNTDTSEAVTVSVGSDFDALIEYPSSVVIPAGVAEVGFVVKAKSNDVGGDGCTAILTVTADGYVPGNIWFVVTDQTLPDAQIADFSVSVEEVEAGGIIEVNVHVANMGLAELPEQTKVGIYSDNSPVALATWYLQRPLGVGESILLSRQVAMPSPIGVYRIHAVVNDENSAKELTYTNNTSQPRMVKTVSPFSVDISTGKPVYKQGETVTLSGRIFGKNIGEKDVEIYVVNDNYRHTIQATTDEQGLFGVDYTPYYGQIGHFVAGACYPGEKLVAEMVAFDVYGVKRTSYADITCEVPLGEPYRGRFGISNPGNLLLSNVRVEVVSKPADCEVSVICPDMVEAGAVFDVEYVITPKTVTVGEEWQQISLNLTSSEGVTLPVTIYYYCISANGQLKASVKRLHTTMVKDVWREYPFTIANIGKGETGKITLDLPSWMSSATPAEMPSLAYGDSATIILRFAPTADMQLNVPMTGNIGVNCSNGQGLSIPYYIEPVSETIGTLLVDVCDEYTYYTTEAPHVEGARVTVTHPTTGSLVAEGITGKEGTYAVVLPEGYYAVSVSAPGHNSYRNNVLVDPGKESKTIVNLSIEAITIDWNVKETTIEDEYSVTTTVKYETNVPVPIVELNMPSYIAAKSLPEGESLVFHATLTNKGLITAEDVSLLLPDGFRALQFEALGYNQPFDLDPQQSIQIPVKVTHVTPQATDVVRAVGNMQRIRPIDDDPCVAHPGTLYYWDCGNDRQWHRYKIGLQLGSCKSSDPSTWDNTGNGNYGGGGYGWRPGCGGIGGVSGSGGNSYSSSSNQSSVSLNIDKGCEPCQNRELMKWVECGTSFIPVYGCVKGSADCVNNSFEENLGKKHYIGCALTGIGCATDLCAAATAPTIVGIPVAAICKTVGIFTNVISCLIPFRESCDREVSASTYQLRTKGSEPDYLADFRTKAAIPLQQMEGWYGFLTEIFGDKVWVDKTTLDELYTLLTELYFSDDEVIDKDKFMMYKPERITVAQFERFIVRLNNTDILENKDAGNVENSIRLDVVKSCCDMIQSAEEASMKLGYASTDEMWLTEAKLCKERLDESAASVCSSITLQISQKMVLTRQAFRGTLTVHNGNETTAMTDIKLSLTVKDENGNLATNREFQINPEKLSGFEGELSLDAGWALDAQEKGTVNILFIPTRYAAPTVEKIYYFGGSLSFIDPFTGLQVTRTLAPVALTVKPSPLLDLTYFMQRDVIGDDALTEAVEPSEEAEFALLIHNTGNGDATNVQMLTDQPQIIENEKGLYIDFELMGCQLNGVDKALALGGSVATDFGTIPAKGTSYAQWWMRSSLLGHFTDYDVEATHVTSHDNPDLSLLGEVTVRELIRSLVVADSKHKAVGFLTNDLIDAADTPDMIYLSNGEKEGVAMVKSAVLQKISATEFLLKVSPEQEGWNYGNVLDLTYGTARLKKVVRQSDGLEMPLRNFWQTDRTLRDGKEPLYENRIHFADDFSFLQEETFLLVFEPRPVLELEVESYVGLPEENSISKEQLAELRVKFNKPIKAETFTTEDISIACQGKALDASKISVVPINEYEYRLNLREVTGGDGYYVLTVQTAGIVDMEGFAGSIGKQASWIQFVDGKVSLKLTASPAEGGTLSPSSGQFDYGSEVAVKAIPANEYDFVCWQIGDEKVSDECKYTHRLLEDVELKALFSVKHFEVTIGYDLLEGLVEGAASGIYKYGTQFWLKAIPADGYEFDAWLVSGERTSESESYHLTVRDDADIEALFKELPPVGLEVLDADVARLTVTPMPVSDVLFLSGDFHEIHLVNIYDMCGVRCLSVQHVQPSEGLYVGRLSAGIYYLQVVSDKGVFSTKIVKR